MKHFNTMEVEGGVTRANYWEIIEAIYGFIGQVLIRFREFVFHVSMESIICFVRILSLILYSYTAHLQNNLYGNQNFSLILITYIPWQVYHYTW